MKDNVGLFGYAINAEIKNVCIQGFLEIFSGRYIGGVAAMVKRVENVYSDISIEIHTSLASSFIGGRSGNRRKMCTTLQASIYPSRK